MFGYATFCDQIRLGIANNIGGAFVIFLKKINGASQR